MYIDSFKLENDVNFFDELERPMDIDQVCDQIVFASNVYPQYEYLFTLSFEDGRWIERDYFDIALRAAKEREEDESHSD